MNNEKIILELFGRVKELEQKVERLENVILLSKEQNENVNEELGTEDENTKVTRNLSRKYTMDKLKENNSNILVDKGNRAMGSGIVITDEKTGVLKKAKFYHSKSFHDDFPAGWHAINEEDVNDRNIDFIIFNVEHKKQFYTFIFTRDELQKYVVNKIKDQKKNYHFYFQVKNNKVLECRDDEKDVSRYLNRWDIVSQ